MALPPRARSTTELANELTQQAQQYINPNQGLNQASNPIGLISSGLGGIQQSLNAPAQRQKEQANLERANAIRLEQQGYDRQQATQARQDALDAQGFDQQLRQATFDAGREDASALADYRQGQTDLDQQTLDLNKDKFQFDKEQSLKPVKDTFTTVQGDDGSIRVFNETSGEFTGGVVEAGKPTSNYQQVKNGDGKVVGAFDVSTGDVKRYDLKPDDSINDATGFPNSWTKGQVAKGEGARSAYSTAKGALDVIDTITPEDISNVTGVLSLGGQITPNTRSSAGKFNQLLGQEFLGNVEQLKGLGSLSNAEGSKITAAANGLVDAETNTLRTGLDADFVASELNKIESSYGTMQRIAEFTETNGREPSINELNEITPVLDAGGVPYVVGGAGVTESDILQTMKDNNLSRKQVIDRLQGGN